VVVFDDLRDVLQRTVGQGISTQNRNIETCCQMVYLGFIIQDGFPSGSRDLVNSTGTSYPLKLLGMRRRCFISDLFQDMRNMKGTVRSIPFVWRDNFHLTGILIDPKIMDVIRKHTNGLLDAHHIRWYPKTVFAILKARIKKRDHRLKQVILLMVKLTEMSRARYLS